MRNTAADSLNATQWLHIAVAVIRDAQGHVLISQRRAGTPGAGLWEYPGGKCEAGETIEAALLRELQEELGITPTSSRPLIQIRHRYPDRNVLLDTWLVTAWTGEAHGREGQALAWVPVGQLPQWELLPANGPLTQAARLPDRYLVTPEPGANQHDFLQQLDQSLQAGLRLVRLRAWQLADKAYEALAVDCQALCARQGAQLLLDRDPDMVTRVGAAGLHLSARQLHSCSQRPPGLAWLAASCHDAAQLAQAAGLGCDFAVLGPVQATSSHPQEQVMGWAEAAQQIGAAALPVYAIGGLASNDLPAAFAAGAQGIAAIRGLWVND